MAEQLLAQREQVQAQGKLLAELQRGQVEPGQGYAARLSLIARSIPANVWITDINADGGRMELSGFTLAPAAIDQWQAALAASILLDGQALAAIRVEKAKPNDSLRASGSAAPLWSFTLKSAPAVMRTGVKP
jgi:Tfp pilus assembly protein PilN